MTDYQIHHLGNPSGLPENLLKIHPCSRFNSRPIIIHHNVNDFALSSEKFKFVMYADDTTLTSTLETFSTNELNGNPASSINIELNKISEWLKLNRLTLNVQKTKYMLFKTSKKKVQTLL